MLQPETKEYTRTVLARPYGQLPMKKDLPRLAKVIQICDGDGHSIHYKPRTIPESDPQAPPGNEALRRLLLKLTFALEGEPEARKLEDLIAAKTAADGVYLPEVLNDVFEEMGGDGNRVVKTLKACNQDAIAKPVIELKVKMGMENTTKDVSNSWRIIIIVESDHVHVLNKKRELCVKCRFELEWELTISLERHVMNGMEDAKLMVVDIAFSDDLSASGRQEIRNTLKSYLSEMLMNRKLYLPMLEEWASDEMGHVRKKKNQAPTQEGVLLPGEKILWADPMVTFVHHPDVGIPSTNGLLFLTNYRLFFQEMGRHEHQFRYELALTVISSVIKDKKTGLDIVCNDFRICRLGFSGKQRKSFTDCLQKFMPTVSARLFAFANFRKVFRTYQDVMDKGGDGAKQATWIYGGWRLYDPLLEYSRMKLDWKRWRITGLANMNFEVCNSYPSMIPVPKDITDYDIKNAARARRENRFPVMCWRYDENGAVLCRSAALLSQSKEDEKLMTAIISACCLNEATNTLSASGSVVESVGAFTRGAASPLLSSNKMKRGRSRKASVCIGDHVGTFYIYDLASRDGTAPKETQSTTQIASDKNILVVNQCLECVATSKLVESFKQLSRVCCGHFAEDRFLTALDSTRWLDHIQLLLENALHVSEKLQGGHSVMLVGKDGNDRTLQLSSLVSILLDPYYRTLEGFIVLIEKEWLSYGHKFSDRSGILSALGTGEEYVPIFLQFIECVWQLTKQFPCAFEYNSRFLRQIMKHSLSSYYGTFVLNSEAERRSRLVRIFSKSFWLYVAEKRGKFFNGFFTPMLSPLFPETCSRSLSFWSDYYLYWYHYTLRRAGPAKNHRRPKTVEQWSNETLKRSLILPTLGTSTSASEKVSQMKRYVAQLERAKELVEAELLRRPAQLATLEEEALLEEEEQARRDAEFSHGRGQSGPQLISLHKRRRDDDALAAFGLPTVGLENAYSLLDRGSGYDEEESEEEEVVHEPLTSAPVQINSLGSSSTTSSSGSPTSSSPQGGSRPTLADSSSTFKNFQADMTTLRHIRKRSSGEERGAVNELAPPSSGWGAAVKPAVAKEEDHRLSIGRGIEPPRMELPPPVPADPSAPPPPSDPPPKLFLLDLPPPPFPDDTLPLPSIPPPSYAPPPPF